MSFDDLQKAWQSQNPTAQVTIQADLLLKEVRRNQRQFQATIFWRDVREVGVAFLLALYFSRHGWQHHNWTDYLSAVACAGVGIFMVVDRVLQRKKRPVYNDSLKGCLEASLAQLDHQIWLLKNVLWWYMSPLMVTGAISMIYSACYMRHFGPAAIVGEIIAVLIVVAIFWGVYWVNQLTVRKHLEPRRQELEALAVSVGNSSEK
jgi:hypothetical protein